MLKTIIHGINIIRSKVKDIAIGKKRSSKWHSVEKHFLANNPCCAICNGTKRLNVHHKKPFHLFPELELEVSNLVTLCMGDKECHLRIGHAGSFRSYNPNIDSDILTLRKDMSKFELIYKIAKINRK
jgi:5-methylcytosine-specific restriction enzyme A